MKENSVNDKQTMGIYDKVNEIQGNNPENIEDKKLDEGNLESNTDSNKSNMIFINPSNITSSSGSTSKDYMASKSINNLNILFNQDSKQQQRRNLSNPM